jgi:hypothetical protein
MRKTFQAQKRREWMQMNLNPIPPWPDELNPKISSTKTWDVAKEGTNGAQPPDINSSPIIKTVPTIYPHNRTGRKSGNFLHPIKLLSNRNTRQRRLRRSHQFVNRSEELGFGMSNLIKMQTIGCDLIYNNMLKNLKEQNRNHILHLQRPTRIAIRIQHLEDSCQYTNP